MWQKCPICNGTGLVSSYGISSTSSSICSVCQGMKIISEVNGLPPASVPPTSNTTVSNITHPMMNAKTENKTK